MLDFTDPARPFVRLTIPASPPAAFLPDGRIVTGGRDGLLRAWGGTGREVTAPIRVGDNAVYGLDVSPSGRLIATQDRERTLRILSLDGRLLAPPVSAKSGKPGEKDCDDLEFGSSSPAFSPDERIVVYVTHCGGIAAVTTGGRLVALDDADISSVQAMEFSRDGRRLIVRFVHQPGATTIIWPLEGGRFGAPETLPEPLAHREFRSVRPGFGPHIFLAAGESRVIGLGADGRATDFAIEFPGVVSAVLSADGSRIAIADERQVTQYGLDGRPLAPADVARPAGRPSLWTDAAAAAATGWPGGDIRILFDDDRLAAVLLGRPARIAALALSARQFVHFSPDGARILVDVIDGGGRSLSLHHEDSRLLAPPIPGWAVSFAPDSSMVAFGDTSRAGAIVVHRYDRDGAVLGRSDLGPDALGRMAFSWDGGRVAVSNRGTIRFLDRNGNLLEPRIATGIEYIRDLAPAPDGGWLVLSGGDKPELHLWSAAGTRLAGPLPIPVERADEARFTPDGRHIVTSDSRGSLKLWSLAPPGGLALRATRADLPYYTQAFGFAGDRVWAASRHALTWLGPDLAHLATVLLLPDGHLAALGDGRHCGAGPVFETRRAFRGTVELAPAERDALVDCAAVRAALGGR